MGYCQSRIEKPDWDRELDWDEEPDLCHLEELSTLHDSTGAPEERPLFACEVLADLAGLIESKCPVGNVCVVEKMITRSGLKVKESSKRIPRLIKARTDMGAGTSDRSQTRATTFVLPSGPLQIAIFTEVHERLAET